ncbi:hypothetical protein [Novosphingobium sp. KN65.2]|uniref:hypothetical protein n=1 Tax=Novosphingobium sp. KN65.2 TaxID=1478134 RepID=UPI0005E68330|nr:hypothetical protein [Novosphingobium sp. KN65.2]CDO34028.1 conserved hypothetical protein [Novosphingobium sp. KN65.2]
MVATPARIGFITEKYRRATSGPDAGVVSRYGSLARDTTDPIETYFDDVADAQVMSDERLALLKETRRLLAIGIPDTSTGFGISYQPVIPTAHVIDDERAYASDALIVSIEIDTGAEVTNLLTWG